MFKDYAEFWEYCMFKCPRVGFGCAKQCELRRVLKQPPFGNQYKLFGCIDQVSAEEALEIEAQQG